MLLKHLKSCLSSNLPLDNVTGARGVAWEDFERSLELKRFRLKCTWLWSTLAQVQHKHRRTNRKLQMRYKFILSFKCNVEKNPDDSPRWFYENKQSLFSGLKRPFTFTQILNKWKSGYGSRTQINVKKYIYSQFTVHSNFQHHFSSLQCHMILQKSF